MSIIGFKGKKALTVEAVKFSALVTLSLSPFCYALLFWTCFIYRRKTRSLMLFVTVIVSVLLIREEWKDKIILILFFGVKL